MNQPLLPARPANARPVQRAARCQPPSAHPGVQRQGPVCATLAPLAAVAALGALTGVPALAQQSQGAGGVAIVPSLSVQETLTSNRDLSSSNAQADAITEIRPGIRISSRGGRVQGTLAYSLNAVLYAREAGQSTLQNALDANGRAELVPNHVFVDATANVSQQSISAFGTQGNNQALRNSNRSEVATASVRPSVRGNLGGFAEVNAGAHWTLSRSDGTALGDSSTQGANIALNGGRGFLLWGVNASRDAYAFRTGRDTQTDQITGSLTYVARYDLRVGARIGTSRSDVLTGSRQSEPTSGWSVNWQPTDRTDIALTGDKTYYGDSHSYSLRHRMARSVWSYVDTSGVSGPPGGQPGQPGQGGTLTLYDLYFNLCLATGNNAVSCDQLVRAELLRLGLNPTGVVTLGFLNSSLTKQRSQVLSVSYAALRTTFTLSASRNETQPLGPVGGAGGDLSQGIAVRQQSYTFGVSHQLTSTSSLSASASQQTTPDAGVQTGNRLRSASLGWSLSPGPRTSLTLSGRHSRFTGGTGSAGDYNESAVVGSLGLRF